MIHSVQKALHILSVLSDAKSSPVTLKEISFKTGYPKPTCAHLLETLHYDGYVVRASHSEGYLLGPSIYYLTRYGRYKEELVRIAHPVIRSLERKTHATVILSIIQSNQKYIIDYSDIEQNLFSEHPIIRTDDIYRTAAGKAILAHMEQEQIKAIWDKYGAPPKGHWDEITSFDSLILALKKIRQQKIVVSKAMEQSGERSAMGIACPLFQHSRCVGAIGIALKPTPERQTFDMETEKQLCNILQKGAREIMRRLSYEEQI